MVLLAIVVYVGYKSDKEKKQKKEEERKKIEEQKLLYTGYVLNKQRSILNILN